MSVVSVQRALIILKHLSEAPNGASVRETARRLAISPSSVQKCLQALLDQRFAVQDPATQLYYLGPAALQVGLAGLAKLELRQVAHPHLEALVAQTGETALLGIRQGDHVTYIDKVVSSQDIRLDPPLGAARPMNCTAIGKMLLAYAPDTELELLAEKGAFAQPTPHSLADSIALKLELARIRETGVAFDREEFLPGAMCIAAAVRNYDGKVIAAVNVSGPVQRMKITETNLIQSVLKTAKAISASLGNREETNGR